MGTNTNTNTNTKGKTMDNTNTNRDHALQMIQEQTDRLFSQRDRMELLAGTLEYAFLEYTDNGHNAYTALKREIVEKILHIQVYD
jgi:hypothetical protein